MRSSLKTLIFGAFSLSALASAQPSEPQTIVTLSNDVLTLNGTLTQEATDTVQTLFNQAKEKPTTLNISSDGGDILVGMALGQWVFEQQLDVRVDQYCLSSCANYIFPAGKTKYLGNRALIGYHGGASSDKFDTSEMDQSHAELPESERLKEEEKAKKAMDDYLADAREKEAKFYRMIGVQQRISTLGQDRKYDNYCDQNCYGWTYIPADFAKFGVTNIIVTSPPWQLTDYKGTHMFIANVE